MKGPKPTLQLVTPMKGDAPRDVPQPPAFLSEEGRAVWDRLAPVMVRKDRLELHFHDLFAAYCESAADFMQFTIDLVADGYSYVSETRNGRQEKKRAAWGQRQEALQNMQRIGALFGLSPVDEQRISSGGQGDLLDLLTKAVSGESA